MKRLKQVLENQGDNYIMPFFWQHGEDEKTLREYMRVIHSANIGAVCVESRPHPDFVGDKWWDDMDIILDEAKKLDMKVWILDDSHFPTGYANGAMKDAPKNLHHKYMCYRTLEMAGPVSQMEFDVKEYMQPKPQAPWLPAREVPDDDFADDKLLKVLACPVLEKENLGEAIDLTESIVDGKAVFDLPEGYFKIFVVYISRNGQGRNDYINFLDKDSCKILVDTVYVPHYEHYKDLFGNVIAGFFSDEPPIGNVEGYMPSGPIGTPDQILPWSDVAFDRLTQEYGSIDWMRQVPYLWYLAFDKSIQAKIRHAFMNMVTKLVAECFSQQNGTWCHNHGVEYIGHMLEDCDMHMGMGTSMGHYFRGLSGQDMAGIDNIGGQVTIGGQNVPRHDQPACLDEAGFYQYTLAKLGASHAAIDPKKKGRTMCETFGAYGWQSGPKEQKYMIDHFVSRGVNRFVPHAFSPAPFPDMDCPPHFYAHAQNPTYRAFGQLMAYTNRVCHLIDGGIAYPDVAVLYAAEGVWQGEGESNIPICRWLAQEQVDFHIIPSDVFKEESEYPMEFDGHTLIVNGVKYKALIISKCTYLDEDVEKFIEKAKKTNFPVFFTEDVEKYLKSKLSLETQIEPANKLITTYKYNLEGHDELLVFNEMASTTYRGKICVRALGIPVRYYPWENKLAKVEYKKLDEDHIEIECSIHGLELCIFFFVDEMDEALLSKYEFRTIDKTCVQDIKEFKVGKVESALYPQQPKSYDVVKAPFVGMQKMYPDFSGFYIYECLLESLEKKRYTLEIDQVYESVEVFFNGKSLGTRVQAPYIFEINAGDVCEKNCLRIEVATLLERKIKAMKVNTISMSPQRPLCPTGIVGSVRIYSK